MPKKCKRSGMLLKRSKTKLDRVAKLSNQTMLDFKRVKNLSKSKKRLTPEDQKKLKMAIRKTNRKIFESIRKHG